MMRNRIFHIVLCAVMLLAGTAMSGDFKILKSAGKDKAEITERVASPFSHGGTLARIGGPSKRNILGIERENAWRLPSKSLGWSGPQTLRVLVLRFDFVADTDPLTTGNGKFDIRDTLQFFAQERHLIDPAPHYREYFEKHMDALNNYYQAVSDSLLTIEYDVFPRQFDSVYHLPRTMSYYGSQPPNDGLGYFLIDCIELVDMYDDEVVFGDYDSYFLIHAGPDRQNDVLSNTPNDLYTANVFLNPDYYIEVDGGAHEVRDAIVFPEATSQDGRVVAMNAVVAHEFGHQLGLVDLYNTGTNPPLTRVGDFALMDNMGRGTVVRLPFAIGDDYTERLVSDVFPVAPMAWSRAYLGFVEPVVYRENTSIELAAALMHSDGVKVAKIPINEHEYFLLENRQEEIDGESTNPIADRATTVILGPGKAVFDTVQLDPLVVDTSLVLTGEYDILLPGSGMLIWHVNEAIAARDTLIGGQSINFFDANILQILPNEPFIELVEADGIQHFGRGYYAIGYVGIQRDMYYAGNNTSLTPTSVPPSETFAGANSDVYIEYISSSGLTMSCDFSHDFMAAGFPRRGGYPRIGFSPIVDDIDGDDDDEIIFVSGNYINIINADGSDYWSGGTPRYDSVFSSVGSYEARLPLFRQENHLITTGPVTGDFGLGGDKYIAVATYNPFGGSASVRVYYAAKDDAPADGQPDLLYSDALSGVVVWCAFRDSILSCYYYDGGKQQLVTYNNGGERPVTFPEINEPEPFGVSLIGENYAVLAGASDSVRLYYVRKNTVATMYELDGPFYYGPVTVDLERDGQPEIIVATPRGRVKAVTVDTTTNTPSFSYKEIDLNDVITVNPVIADISNNGYPDIVLTGSNRVYALDRNLVLLTDFPATIDRSYPKATVVSSPIVADIDRDGRQDIMVVMSNGNLYALGPHRLYNFPINAGNVGVDSILTFNGDWGRRFVPVSAGDVGSPVVFSKSDRGGLGFLGADGWFYAYDVWYDGNLADWAMYGGGPDGSLEFSESQLIEPLAATSDFPADSLYCYPNPTLDGQTRLRYFVGGNAEVGIRLFDLTGVLVYEDKFYGEGGTSNERQLNLSFLPTGIYRCKVKVNISGAESSNYTDIAIVK